jgi:hypothetical protein
MATILTHVAKGAHTPVHQAIPTACFYYKKIGKASGQLFALMKSPFFVETPLGEEFMMQAFLRQVPIWFVGAILSTGAFADPVSEQNDDATNPYDPTRFIEYQEFQSAKEKEKNSEKLRFRLVDKEGVSYLQLQSDNGTILMPSGPDLNRESLKDAKCTITKPIPSSEAVLTKVEYEISKRINVYSSIIIATINKECASTNEVTVPYAKDAEVGIQIQNGDKRTSIFSRQSLPNAIKGYYNPNLGIRTDY